MYCTKKALGENPVPFLWIISTCFTNMTPIPRHSYRVGVPSGGVWKEVFNSDATAFFGSGVGNGEALQTEETAWHGRQQSLLVTLPPLGGVVLKKSSL